MSETRGLFDHTVGMLQRSLGLFSLRHRIISDNIANSENQNHVVKDVSFQEVLKQAAGGASSLILSRTDSRHLGGDLPQGGEITFLPGKVELDEEMGRLAQNNLLFQASVQAILKKLDGLKHVIQEGGR